MFNKSWASVTAAVIWHRVHLHLRFCPKAAWKATEESFACGSGIQAGNILPALVGFSTCFLTRTVPLCFSPSLRFASLHPSLDFLSSFMSSQAKTRWQPARAPSSASVLETLYNTFKTNTLADPVILQLCQVLLAAIHRRLIVPKWLPMNWRSQMWVLQCVCTDSKHKRTHSLSLLSNEWCVNVGVGRQHGDR